MQTIRQLYLLTSKRKKGKINEYEMMQLHLKIQTNNYIT